MSAVSKSSGDEEASSELSEDDQKRLASQDTRPVPEFRANKFQSESRKHWDIFYKRNADRFFKDRHWTIREFEDLAGGGDGISRVLLEVGCGAGNFAFPLLQEVDDLFVFACDFSPRAVQIVRENSLYDEDRIKAFQCDVTAGDLPEKLGGVTAHIASMVFVLSAVRPEQFQTTFENLRSALADGGVLLFRDYAVNDMAMIRFGAGTKIAERHYLRQDGTTSYFFALDELSALAEAAGFAVRKLEYVHRKTVNKKEELDVDRIFVQGVFVKQQKCDNVDS
jgi:methyltransferase-like protein 6